MKSEAPAAREGSRGAGKIGHTDSLPRTTAFRKAKYRNSVANNLVDALPLAGWPWNRRLSLYLDWLEEVERCE